MIRRTVLLVTLFIIAGNSFVLAKPGGPYKILMPGSYTVSGKNTEQMEQFTGEIVNGLSKSIDVDITVEISPLNNEQFVLHALLRMLKKDVDFAGFSGDWYVKMSPWLRGKFPIFFGLVIDKKKYMNNCFFVRKSDELESIEDLRGGVIGGNLYIDSRYLLYRAGIDEPVMDFFSDYKYLIGPYTDHLDALVNGEIDTFVSWDFNVDTTINVDPRYMDVTKMACNVYGLNPFVIYRQGIDEELVDKAREALRDWRTNPNFQDVRLFFVGIKGGIAELGEEDLGLNLKLDEAILDKGWDKEYKEFREEYIPKDPE